MTDLARVDSDGANLATLVSATPPWMALVSMDTAADFVFANLLSVM